MKKYQILSGEKKAEQAAKIPEEWTIDVSKYEDRLNVMDVPHDCGILDAAELTITSDFDATELVDKMKTGVHSVQQVTTAFCKRAAISHQLTNCLTEIFFEHAIERARQLDKLRLEQSTKELPPLFGIPVSLKDSFAVKGHDTSTGLGCYVNEPAKKHSAIAALLLDLGAVLYCKTNLPQAILTGDSQNFIFGRTLNPRNKLLTAGGSTGGEGALLALRGSILGMGTDIAGSIRVPATCNGLYGFRPSVGLIPHGGVRDITISGMGGVMSTAGPLATSLRDCFLFTRSVLGAETWRYDSTAVSIPWTKVNQKPKLRIGVAWNNGLHTPSPPMRRGLKQSVDALREESNIEIVDMELPDIKRHLSDVIRYLASSGGEHFLSLFAETQEPVIPSLEATGLLALHQADQQTMIELDVCRAEAKTRYLQLFVDNHLDAIIMPPAPHTAVPVDSWSTVSYTGLWNYLDYPAITIPVDQVRVEDLADDLGTAMFGLEDEKVYRLYTGPNQYQDMPVCIQVVGYHQKDEALLQVAAQVDSILTRG